MGYRRGFIPLKDFIAWLNSSMANVHDADYLGFFGVPARGREVHMDMARQGFVVVTQDPRFPYTTPEEAPEEDWGEGK